MQKEETRPDIYTFPDERSEIESSGKKKPPTVSGRLYVPANHRRNQSYKVTNCDLKYEYWVA
ncbi:MAG: hypothetical protein AAB886_00435 [Patescibacteria group bacterium]